MLMLVANTTGYPYKQCVCLCSKYKEMYGRILKTLNIVNMKRALLSFIQSAWSKKRDSCSLAHEIRAADADRFESCISRKLLGG